MWDQSNDMNQMGDPSQQMGNQTPQQSGNYLTPQQKMQMGQYANSLMSNQGGAPSNTVGAGLANMGKAAIGGYLANQAYGPPQANNTMNGIFGNVPTPQTIMSGIFGGNAPAMTDSSTSP